MGTKVKEKIEKVVEIVNKVKEKIVKNLNNKNNIKLNKQNIKYYSILLLMIAVAILTTYLNIINYEKVNEEEYTKYSLNIEKDKNTLDKQEEIIETMSAHDFKTGESSLSTVKYKKEGIWPVQGTVIQPYSMDNVIYYESLGIWKVHSGVDISSFLDEDVICILDGKVIGIYNDDVLGYSVVVEGKEYTCIYSSLSNETNVKIGENIKSGARIGKVSLNPSEENLGYHLHFEVLKEGEYVDPKVLGIE
ncbi:MAG: M23 family metallopeptidase [Clostridia bacterium]|nr:M23 family metallopeptidase [Clostridia bacterium]